MGTENTTAITKPQAAPLKWREGAVVHTSLCGVYRIDMSDCLNGGKTIPCYARGNYLGARLSLDDAFALCQWDRQREYDIMGGFPHEGISELV